MMHILFDILSACAHFMWNLLGAIAGFAMNLFSAAFTVLTWPFKAFGSILNGTFSWMPLFLTACLVLGVLLVLLAVLALYSRIHSRFK